MLLFIVIWYKRGYFNTSHVTVYLFGLSVLYFFDSFQYIPCYCLSISKIILKIKHFYFNTSHVTVYPQCIRNLPHFLFISIHPMLLFITEATRRAIYKYEFQYIPCYCLSCRLFSFNSKFSISIHPMLLFILRTVAVLCTADHFNTSHVTVYLKG